MSWNIYIESSLHGQSDTEIARLIGQQFVHSERREADLENIGVTWIHREVWTYAYSQNTTKNKILDNIEIAPDLFCTAAGEDMLGSMEMGCRMGLDVAKDLYYSKWLGETIP